MSVDWRIINGYDPSIVKSVERFTPLTHRVIDIWLFSHQQSEQCSTHLKSLLSAEEVGRAQQYQSATLQNQFIVRRATLRYLLGRYTQQSPSTIRLQTGTNGKLALEDSPYFFNLSHSQEMVAVAVSFAPVGIDIESIQPLPNMALIAQDHFSQGEQTTLFDLSASEQLPAFYRCWTRKEALIKADGRGITIPLDSFEVKLNESAQFIAKSNDLSAWHLANMTFSPAYIGAVASLEQIQQVRYWLVKGETVY